ncbi:hypothetical protein [Streptomyces sp. NPDC085937]|uniref:hypothetical protein n=1 Tax=Streptomyces sp. NPDC085937 TaxID=3365742 RepID=UPI0037D706D8
MHLYEDPSTWTPEPPRSRAQLILRFAATLLCAPLLGALWLAAAAVLFVVGLFAEVITAVSDRFERGYLRFMGATLRRITRLGSWFVTWPELRHEGDTEYYRARVDRRVSHWTTAASVPREPKKARPPVECAIPLRDYRGVGAGYVAEVAVGQGWELRPSNVHEEVRLWWAAASHTG